ncbi:MAG: hypothetical protein KDG57_01975 [Rhodoferax sp.]|nr:hypothetical protein [Rhodoferax sp.]
MSHTLHSRLATLAFALFAATAACDSDEGGPPLDLTTDADNCGEIGHSCLGGLCSDAQCRPVAVVDPSIVAGGSGGIIHGFILTDDELLFSAQALDTNELHIYRMVFDAPVPTSVAAEAAEAFARDEANVYWTTSKASNDGGRGLVRYPLAGGEGTVLAHDGAFFGVAVGAGSVYFADGAVGEIKRVPATGGDVEIVATGASGPRAVAVDDQSVYWVDTAPPCGLKKAPVGGGDVTVVVADSCGSTRGLALDAGNAYWVDSSDDVQTGGAVRTVPLEGGADVVLGSSPASPVDIAVDDSGIYWLENGTTPDDAPYGALKYLSYDGGTPTVLFRAGPLHVLRLSDDSVYFSTLTGIYRLAK